MYEEWDEIENQLSNLSNLIEKNNEYNKNQNTNEDEYIRDDDNYSLDKKKNMELNSSKMYDDKKLCKYLVPTPTELRISTMTCLSSLSTDVNLDVINKYLEINEEISYIDPGGKEPTRGIPKKMKSNKSTKKKKMFFNQTTLLIIVPGNKHVNLKIFTNGNIQMTGLKSEEDGYNACEILKKNLINTRGIIDGKIVEAIIKKNEISIKKINVVLINSDYFCGYKIKRDVLHRIIVKDYKLFSLYEPCIYPGVNTKYFWNELNDCCDGLCKCTKKCMGKGNGNGNGECKKITISVFQSGNVIITGARNLKQIHDSYNFINNLFKENYDILKKEPNPLLDSYVENNNETKKNKIIMIKKKNIR